MLEYTTLLLAGLALLVGIALWIRIGALLVAVRQAAEISARTGEAAGRGSENAAKAADAVTRQEAVLDTLRQDFGATRGELREEHGRFREEMNRALNEQRTEVRDALTGTRVEVTKRLETLTETTAARLEVAREAIERKLQEIREDNTARLEQMRQTVDEKLQTTLETRLGESFRLVGEQLERVQSGLGEMQTLATGVGDLKRVLTNVKARGTWGEIQLAALLEQILTPEQYGTNVAVKEGSLDRVEFAIKLPGHGDAGEGPVWLPIDAKFPQEDYLRLEEAREVADLSAMETAAKALERSIRECAKAICTKYLDPPRTTDMGIMFLPTESLYAEVARRPGLLEALQREYRVMVAGPSTLAALLNSLQMGFRTLAIQKRSSEVWTVLGNVKTQFGKFEGLLQKVHKKLQEATNTVEDTQKRTRVLGKKMEAVEALPAADSLGLPMPEDDEIEMEVAPALSGDGRPSAN